MTHPECLCWRCWRCWFQTHFTVLVLLWLTLVSLFATIILMHEDAIADKYVIWMQGWDASVFAAFTLSLQLKPGKPDHQVPDPLPAGTTRKTDVETVTSGTVIEAAPPAPPQETKP